MKWIYKKSFKSELRRKEVDDDEKELINVIIIIKISECLNTKDKQLLSTLKTIYKLYNELRVKYTDRLPIKNKKLIREFHNYRLDTSETIKYA